MKQRILCPHFMIKKWGNILGEGLKSPEYQGKSGERKV
jgi:hypothetical protein